MVVMWDVNLTTLVFLGLTHTQCGDCTLEIIGVFDHLGQTDPELLGCRSSLVNFG